MADDFLLISTDQLQAPNLTDLLPGQATSDEEKIALLLDVLADPSNFTGDEDIDLVRDAALCGLLQFPKLPEQTIAIMLSILANMGDSDLDITRKMAACDVLGHMRQQAGLVVTTLCDLLPLVRSDSDFKRWLALRAAKAIWQITGDREFAVDVAEKLIEDEEFWLVIHATELLREIYSSM